MGRGQGNEVSSLCLWLDDLRPAPRGWLWVKDVEAAWRLLETGRVAVASLDNDLGPEQSEGRRLVLRMCEEEIWPASELRIHSANPVASRYMVEMIRRYGPYRRFRPPASFYRS